MKTVIIIIIAILVFCFIFGALLNWYVEPETSKDRKAKEASEKRKHEKLVSEYSNSQFTDDMFRAIQKQIGHDKLVNIKVLGSKLECTVITGFSFQTGLITNIFTLNLSDFGYQNMNSDENNAFAFALAKRLGNDYDAMIPYDSYTYIYYKYEREYLDQLQKNGISTSGLKKTH